MYPVKFTFVPTCVLFTFGNDVMNSVASGTKSKSKSMNTRLSASLKRSGKTASAKHSIPKVTTVAPPFLSAVLRLFQSLVTPTYLIAFGSRSEERRVGKEG